MPAISFKTGNDLVEGGTAAGKAWRDGYTAGRYHQPSDEWSEKWSFAGLARDMEILYGLGVDLANSTAWPNWASESEFRATRDASAAQRR